MELRHETLKDQLSKLDPEVQRLRSENEMLARHSGDLAVEEQKLEGENSRLEEDNRKKSCQVDQRRQSNEVLQQQNNELQDQVREQERRLIRLQTVEQPQLEARLREIQDKINDCIGRFASLNDQIHEAEDQQSEAVETLSRLTGQLQEAKARREEAQRQKTEITQRLASTSADAESLQREIAQISRLLEEENKKDLQDVLEQQRSRLALCRNQLAQQEMDLAAKEEALKDTAAELEAVQTENAQKRHSFSSWSRSIARPGRRPTRCRGRTGSWLKWRNGSSRCGT